jgi:hypothetical protein
MLYLTHTNYLIFFILIICIILHNLNINNYYKNKIIIILQLILIILLFSLSNTELFNNDGIYTAIIIEPRKHRALEYVLTNFTDMLDTRWNFIICHGTQNETFVNDIVNTKLNNHINRIKLINLNVDNLTIHNYNELLYNPSFYELVPTEYFLIFQSDTQICSTYKNNIYKFIDMNYDYVGAPWGNTVGNGGLSLRKKSKMLEIINKCSDRKYALPDQLYNEDVFFSTVCSDKVDIKLPSGEDAKEFGIETVYSDNAFGIHKLWAYQNSEQIENINKFCPGLYNLIELNN